jgi:hypothetical protein
MQKYKYSYGDWKHKRGTLPEDTNVIVRNLVSILKCDNLMATLDKSEKRRAFGEINVYDAKDTMLCSIEMHSGIVKTCRLICEPDNLTIVLPLKVVLLESHRNELWSFRSNEKGEVKNGKEI